VVGLAADGGSIVNTHAAKSVILGRIRDAVGQRSEPAAVAHSRIQRTYTRTSTLDAAARIELFVDRLLHYQVGVSRCRRPDLPAAIAAACAARGKRQLLVPDGFPTDFVPPGLAAVRDASLSYEDLDRCEGVLTLATIAIALTGTIVLTHGPGEGRRAATLIPDYHLCVVRADQIVETVPEALRRLAALEPSLITTISGPSATADIEMIRVRGVHGPRTLDVIVVTG
jgi:L-lactate dehydrogenase complex protein LldG